MSKQKGFYLEDDTQWAKRMIEAQKEMERKREEAQKKKTKKQAKKSGK